MPDTPESFKLDPAKSDAIHRAVLAGLLGNIGFKSDGFEYTGARGIKFNIFPGSGLFKKKPAWIVAAELVETTRLYARTAAAIRPEWIERLAGHLVTRSYAEPHWQEATAHVVAYEKVTLHGLVLVPKRLVHFGPIDPVQARQLFIHHALVEGEYKTAATFFQHNRGLIEQVRVLEAKGRRRDLLVDSQTRFAFYDSKIPADIFNGPLFERWRKDAERTNPQLLYMAMVDLMKPGEALPGELYPDSILVAGMKLPVTYELTPGEEGDGVTVTVPLTSLNQLPADQFEWLVPGMLAEKIEELIRTLPKQLRTKFVPVPDVARAAAGALRAGDGSLLDALAIFLSKRGNAAVSQQSFQPSSIPQYLQMHFRVVDNAGKVLAGGRDLSKIRTSLGQQARESFADLPKSDFNRDGISAWNFGSLPGQVQIQRQGMTLQGYPALVDQGTSVSLRLLDSPQAAQESHRTGVRRLFILAAQGELKYLAASLPGIDRICLHYATLGKSEELKKDVMVAIAQRAFIEGQSLPRDQKEFEQRQQTAWPKMSAAGGEIGLALDKALATYHALQLELSKPAALALGPAIADIRRQIGALVYPGFITQTPAAWFTHLPRYLAAAQARLAKLKNAGLAKDNAAAAQVQPLLQQYHTRRQAHEKSKTRDAELEIYRWMLEEFRVSVFAQELKTSIPISLKRLESQWVRVKSS